VTDGLAGLAAWLFNGGALFCASAAFTALVLAYRSVPRIRRTVDRLQFGATGRPDWKWLRLWHLLVPLALLTLANLFWQVPATHCGNDAVALFMSGQRALHGQDPFLITNCQGQAEPIPYGLAEVLLNLAGAATGAFAGIWVAWQLLALAVVPLVWSLGPSPNRYASVLVAGSVLYLPNIATNIGVENVVVALAVLVMLYALQCRGRRRILLAGMAALLSTARFPAVFPLLGSSAPLRTGRWRLVALVAGVFLGSAAVATLVWGSDAVRVVYLSEFTRNSGPSLNLFALLVHQGWLTPSTASAAVQGALLVGLVAFVQWRRYETLAACAIPLLGVLLLSQYVSDQFDVWLLPLLLMGAAVGWWMLLYGVLMVLDEQVYAAVTLAHGLWWPYELLGVVITVVLLGAMATIVRSEEVRLRSSEGRAQGIGDPPGP
jgi:hypothetical protein